MCVVFYKVEKRHTHTGTGRRSNVYMVGIAEHTEPHRHPNAEQELHKARLQWEHPGNTYGGGKCRREGRIPFQVMAGRQAQTGMAQAEQSAQQQVVAEGR
jgi:hypothetical protein